MAAAKVCRRNLKSAKMSLSMLAEEIQGGEVDPSTADLVLADLEHAKTQVSGCYSEVMKICNDEELEDLHKELSTDMVLVRQCIKRIRAAQPPPPPPVVSVDSRTSTPTSFSASQPSFRPADFHLPKFSGIIADWPAFSALFTDAIESAPSLSGTQKMLLLLDSLTGDARSTVKNLIPSSTTFDEGWALLKAKYDNKRDISYDLVMGLVDHPKVSTHQAISRLVDKARESIRALNILGYTSSTTMDVFIIPIVVSKLDQQTIQYWEKSNMADCTKVPPVEDLLSFLQNWSRTLARTTAKGDAAISTQEQGTQNSRSHSSGNTRKCLECSLDHPLFKCPVLTQATVPDRWAIIRKLRVCQNCFNRQHRTQECTREACRRCNKMHNQLLHQDEEHVTQVSVTSFSAILATARVRFHGTNGHSRVCRMLLDTGSTANYISASVLKELQIVGRPHTTNVTTLTATETICSPIATIRFSPGSGKSCTADFIQMENLPTVPTAKVQTDRSFLKNMRLADPHFDSPGAVDGIMGAAVFAGLLGSAPSKGFESLVAVDTSLGWVLMGSAPSVTAATTHNTFCTLNRFWDLEEVPQQVFLTEEQTTAKNLFQKTTTILPNGRYQVRLPLKSEDLGQSRQQALARFKSLERKFNSNPEFKAIYCSTIEDYFERGDLTPIKGERLDTSGYLPHHGVLTHKLRIVFDASAKTSNGLSVNDITLDCPPPSDNLFEILTRFRTHKIAITADVSQMYRQVTVHPEDRKFQRILWRSDPTQPIQEFELTTVTWGTKSAPFLATSALKDTGNSAPSPLTKKTIQEDFYIDDLLTGADSVEEAKMLRNEITSTLSTHGFVLHKWASNTEQVLHDVPTLLHKESCRIKDAADPSIKTLGLHWDTSSDKFSFKWNSDDIATDKFTKRQILSTTNRIFDPLGLLAPVILRPKILLQRLWSDQSITWDTPLPQKTCRQWLEMLQDFNGVTEFNIPRRIKPDRPESSVLCGYADASEAAFGAVVYLRCQTANDVHVSLVAAKTKVAPLRGTSLPRLELCAALLLANLMQAVSQALHVKTLFAWSDSTVALGWIAAHPSRWQTFVANRVHQIQSIIPAKNWFHIPGSENPADCASRGMSTMELLNHQIWWQGPPSLKQENFCNSATVADPDLERRAAISLVAATFPTPYPVKRIIHDISNPYRARRVMAYVLRFIHNRLHPTQKRYGDISQEELTDADTRMWNLVQRENLTDLYRQLSTNSLPTTSPYLSLAPFVDASGTIRVGGRLKKSDLPYNSKHQILLSARHPLVQHLIRETHIRLMHAGAQAVATHLRQNFWLPNAVSAIKKVLRRCSVCVRHKKQCASQMMADLPTFRTTPSRPFTTTGVDLAGPFMLRTHLARGSKQYKAWVAIFICMTTRAIHIELLTSLNAEAFIATLHRFASRRGCPRLILSDNATNFQAAAKIVESQQLKIHLQSHSIKWQFIPPHAPHFGGLWEAGVRSMKYHLHRVVGKQVLNYEEMSTVLTRIEAVLNSRPLTPLSDDPNDFDVLTPAHFLVGGSMQGIPEEELPPTSTGLRRWQHCQQMAQHFWKRWSAEYLTRLQQRPKWLKPRKNLQIGQLVLIKDDLQHPLQWRLGRITEVHLGADGLVRSAEIRTQHSNFTRPIVKLVPLPLDEEEPTPQPGDAPQLASPSPGPTGPVRRSLRLQEKSESSGQSFQGGRSVQAPQGTLTGKKTKTSTIDSI